MTQTNTGGGASVQGGVTVSGGEFTGRDKIVVEAGGVVNLPGHTPEPPRRIPTRIPEPRARQGLLGREAELAWLRVRLTGPGRAALAGVRGIGGIGKTEVAIAIAHELESHFAGGVIWLECGPHSIASVQDRLASHLGLRLDGNDPALRADQLALALNANPPALTVLDDIRLAQQHSIHLLHPPGVPGALLATSRRRNVLADDAVYTLRTLSPAAAAALLRREVGEGVADAEAERIPQIVQAVEAIPLAIVLAVGYVRKLLARRTPPAQPLTVLLRELTERRAQVLHRDDAAHLSMRITFDLSWEELDASDQRRLACLGVFAANEFGRAGMGYVWEEEDDAIAKAAGRLENSGLIEEIDDGRWWMHDVLREFAAGHLTADERAAARRGHARSVQRFLDGLTLRSLDDWQRLAAERVEIDWAGGWLLADWQSDPVLAAHLAWEFGQKLRNDYNDERIAWLRAGVQAADAAEDQRSKGVVLMDLVHHPA